MTLVRAQLLIYRSGDKGLPSLIWSHPALHCKGAASLRVLVKMPRFSQCSPVQYFESLKRATNLHHRPVRHPHKHRTPLDLSGVRDLSRAHGFPPIQSLPRAKREDAKFVPASLRKNGEAA